MNEYKSVNKYLNKKKESFNPKRFFSKLFSRILCCIILLLGILIYLKIDSNNQGKLTNYLQAHNINFASINNLATKYLGDIFPSIKEETKQVFSEKINYTNASIYQDGVSLTVESNYLVPAMDSGVVVFSGDKELYGKTIIIQQSDGLLVWYGNLSTLNVDIYDYVTKGDFLGEASNETLYMVFQKDEEYKDYKNYLS